MIICICEAVSERRLRAEIRGGARTLRALRKSCGAGGTCGSCVCDLTQILRDEDREAAQQDALPMVAK